MTATSFTQLQVVRTPRPEQFDYTIASFAEPMQKQLTQDWAAKHPAATISTLKPDATQVFDASSQDAQLDHHKNFYQSIRQNQPSIEDATFGLRAAGPALLTNESYFKKKIVGWDPEKMVTKKV